MLCLWEENRKYPPNIIHILRLSLTPFFALTITLALIDTVHRNPNATALAIRPSPSSSPYYHARHDPSPIPPRVHFEKGKGPYLCPTISKLLVLLLLRVLSFHLNSFFFSICSFPAHSWLLKIRATTLPAEHCTSMGCRTLPCPILLLPLLLLYCSSIQLFFATTSPTLSFSWAPFFDDQDADLKDNKVW